jgi:hypothetical protein
VPFYASIFDQKTPGAAFLAALGDALGGFDGIRIAFFVCACLTVVAVYFLALDLWGSVLAAVVAAVAFASFRGFAADALAGPDAKTPGILLAVLSMLAMGRRRWFWAGLCGSLAFLVWQPLGIYAALAVVVSRRWRTAAGVALPLVVTAAYFWGAGALGDFVQAAFAFPVEGLHRTPETIGQRLGHIAAVVHDHYAGAVVQFWAGLALAAILAAWRRVWVVLASLVAIAGFSALDFQGYPDLYPLLPYAALGLGGAVAEALAETTPRPIRRIGIDDTFAKTVGGHEHLLEQHGVHTGAITAAVLHELPAVQPHERRPHEHDRARDREVPRV